MPLSDKQRDQAKTAMRHIFGDKGLDFFDGYTTPDQMYMIKYFGEENPFPGDSTIGSDHFKKLLEDQGIVNLKDNKFGTSVVWYSYSGGGYQVKIDITNEKDLMRLVEIGAALEKSAKSTITTETKPTLTVPSPASTPQSIKQTTVFLQNLCEKNGLKLHPSTDGENKQFTLYQNFKSQAEANAMSRQMTQQLREMGVTKPEVKYTPEAGISIRIRQDADLTALAKHAETFKPEKTAAVTPNQNKPLSRFAKSSSSVAPQKDSIPELTKRKTFDYEMKVIESQSKFIRNNRDSVPDEKRAAFFRRCERLKNIISDLDLPQKDKNNFIAKVNVLKTGLGESDFMHKPVSPKR